MLGRLAGKVAVVTGSTSGRRILRRRNSGRSGLGLRFASALCPDHRRYRQQESYFCPVF